MSEPRPKKPRARSKAQQRAEMIEQILDAAEHLFARGGLYGVTLKEVAARVGVHTSLLHYYFENKDDLFEQVILRRRDEINQRRMEALDRYEAEAGDAVTVEGALHAFLDTNLDVYSSRGEGWVNYGKLGALVSNSAGWGAAIMDKYFDAVVYRLLAIIKRALPEARDEDLFWAYHFTTGAQMLTLARTGRIDTLSQGLCASDDFAAVKARMARFMAAGFEAICGGAGAAGAPPQETAAAAGMG